MKGSRDQGDEVPLMHAYQNMTSWKCERDSKIKRIIVVQLRCNEDMGHCLKMHLGKKRFVKTLRVKSKITVHFNTQV